MPALEQKNRKALKREYGIPYLRLLALMRRKPPVGWLKADEIDIVKRHYGVGTEAQNLASIGVSLGISRNAVGVKLRTAMTYIVHQLKVDDLQKPLQVEHQAPDHFFTFERGVEANVNRSMVVRILRVFTHEIEFQNRSGLSIGDIIEMTDRDIVLMSGASRKALSAIDAMLATANLVRRSKRAGTT